VDNHQVSKLPTAGAIQINRHGKPKNDTKNDWCFVVGYYNQAATTTKLLDSTDPTKGIQISYLGDFCNGGTQRKFHLHLQCADRLNPVPTHAYEYTGCEYTVYMPSVYGCPVECPVANRALCGGQGHCAYDEDKHGARCFCNRGFYGADCTGTDPSKAGATYSPTLLGLIATLFVIICLLVVGIAMMIRQVSAYRDDIANYQVLKGGEDELGNSSRGPMTPGNQATNPMTEMASAVGSAVSLCTASTSRVDITPCPCTV
jgi:hypothetical protein